MSVVVSSSLVLSEGTEFTPDHPIIGWRNVVTPFNVFANFQAPNYPPGNVGNPATFLKWKSTSNALQTFTVNTGTSDPVDYVAVAKHNFGTVGSAVSIIVDGGFVTDPVILPNDGPAIFRFTPTPAAQVTIRMESQTGPPEMGVMYCGKLLVLERRIYANHTPMPQGRVWQATNGMSESGQYLGRIVLSEFVKTKVPLSLLSPTWYRENFDAFLDFAQEEPFFFAWRPQTYPLEVGYGWLTAMPEPMPVAPSNLIALNLELTGVV